MKQDEGTVDHEKCDSTRGLVIALPRYSLHFRESYSLQHWISRSFLVRLQLVTSTAVLSDPTVWTSSHSHNNSWSASTKSKMNDSPLNRLPAELRNNSYELVLTKRCRVIIDHESVRRNAKLKAPNLIANALALTRTCKQIHAESAAIFYARNELTILARHTILDQRVMTRAACAKSIMKPLHAFLTSIGPKNQTALRSIRIELQSVEYGAFDVFQPPMSRLMKLVLLDLREVTDRYDRLNTSIRFARSWLKYDSEWLRYGGVRPPACITVKDGIACIDRLLIELRKAEQATRSHRVSRAFRRWLKSSHNELEDWKEVFREG